MCDMCYGYMYDIITAPLPLNNSLKEYIQMASLQRCASEVTKCFQRAIANFSESPCYRIQYPPSHPLETSLKEYLNDEHYWKTFKSQYPEDMKEIAYAIELCIDNGVARYTQLPSQMIEQFFMGRLRTILSMLPFTHKEHMEKLPPPVYKSRGPVLNGNFKKLI